MLGIGQTTTGCDSFLLNRQGVARPGRRQGRIGGGILEVLDQVVTDPVGSGKIREERSRE